MLYYISNVVGVCLFGFSVSEEKDHDQVLRLHDGWSARSRPGKGREGGADGGVGRGALRRRLPGRQVRRRDAGAHSQRRRARLHGVREDAVASNN